MAPKKKGKKEEQQLQEEAMAEWLARGHSIKDFTMEKMLAIWLEEDGDDEDEKDGHGTLDTKQELMKGMSLPEPVIEQAKEMAEKIKETIKEEASNAIKTAWKYAEIPPLKRRRLLREHVAHVHEMDREANKYVLVRQRVQEEWETAQATEKELAFGLKKRNARKAPLLLRSREMKEEADREQQAQLMEDIERKRRERMDAELAEKQRQRAACEDFANTQRVYRRKMNMKFWKKQYVDAKDYAEQHSLALQAEREDRFSERVALMKAEISDMAGEEEKGYATAFDRQVTTSSVGVFGTPFGPGEYRSSVDGGPREGMDESTVGLFSSRGFEAENELLRTELVEAQSKVMMLREKLEQLDQVKANLLKDKKTVLERKDKILMEIKQVNAEHDELGQQLAGPPRRDPTEDNKQHFHALVTRRAVYMKQLHDLNARDANIQKRSELAVRSEQSLRPMLVKEQDIEAALQLRVDALDEKQLDLPIVVGRSIQREAGAVTIREGTVGIPITAPLVNPTKLYADVTMASKLKLLENTAIPVSEHYKKVKQLAMEDWRTKEIKHLSQQELEVTKTRLSNIREKMIEHHKESLRADLMQAILRFHVRAVPLSNPHALSTHSSLVASTKKQGPLNLRKCISPLKGRLEWWQSHDSSRSNGVRIDETLNALFLEPDIHTGQLRGCARLPKSCFFRIDMTIMVAKKMESGDWQVDGGGEEGVLDQATEKFTLYIGSDFDSLQKHVFLDVGGQPIRTGQVSFEFFGSRLCFSLDMTHRHGGRPQDASCRLVVDNCASYEERMHDFREEEGRMRLIQKETHLLSELVKTLRMQTKKTSSERCADLLEELVLVEKSKAKTWDSTLLHGHQQRFDRTGYANMLRLEIKKELALQIDQDVQRRKGRTVVQYDNAVIETDSNEPDRESDNLHEKRRNLSRMEYLARKHALVGPQYLKSKLSLGEYCSLKEPDSGIKSSSAGGKMPNVTTGPLNEHDSYRKEAIVMGLRMEWREGKTGLHVMHKLYEPDGCRSDESRAEVRRIKRHWYSLESVNAVFLASACAKALKTTRDEQAKERALLRKKEDQVQLLHKETENVLQRELEAEQRERVEDVILEKQKESELRRRAKLFHAEAFRTTTYNEQVSSQVDFLAQRKKNAIDQHQRHHGSIPSASWDEVVREVKEEYAAKYVEGRLALVKKTWERKEKRIHDERDKQRRERDFRIRQEEQLIEAVNSSKDEELAGLQLEHMKRLEDQLKIPNFELTTKGSFPCEHLELKAWGSKYDSGLRCKNCGKEMSKSFDDPDHARGADTQLNRDVEQHRAQVTGGIALRLHDATHFERVEQERVRLEKEAREIELADTLLYDRMDPRAIEEFNYRHNMNRHPEAIEGSDPLYQRTIQDSHHAAFQDEVLFHGRLKNYHFRIHQLTDLHAHTTTMIAVQKDFLEGVQEENEFVLAKLPLVERDHARAITLVEEDRAALQVLEAARIELAKTRKERERAYYALEGVEEEAEFAEFHAPSLIESSEVMAQIVERMRDELSIVQLQTESSKRLLQDADSEHKKTETVLSRLSYRDHGTRVRTRYGFCRVLFYRNEDECVIVSPERWEATIFISVEEIVAVESANRQAEVAMMTAEEVYTRTILLVERTKESHEAIQMALEERDIREIVQWRTKKMVEESLVRVALCDEELTQQFKYETETRKELMKSATVEAKKMYHYSRVSLKRRVIAGKPQARSGRLDVLRVARASEKRLAMAAMEEALIRQDHSLRQTFQREHDGVHIEELSSEVYEDSLATIVEGICKESVDEEMYDSAQFRRVRNHGVVVPSLPARSARMALPVKIQVRLNRLWLARRTKVAAMHEAWKVELTKLQALRQEIARRDEILRQQEVERLLLETRRREMLAEERYCRKFYLEEMVLCMQERKSMASAEMEMREYLRQLELEAMKAKYADMIDERNKANDKAARRLEIKLGKNEKHRLHREWTQIKIEDDLAMQLRDEEISRAQAEALERQFDRFLIQQAVEGKVAAEREAARVAERIKEAQRIATEMRAAFEAKLVQERVMATVEAYYLVTKLELVWMDAAERESYWEKKADTIHSTLEPMEVELKRILSEKDHVVADAKAKRAHAETCKARARDADVALRSALRREADCAKHYRKTHFLTSTMGCDVLHGRPQLFRTIYLRDQLHTRYFSLLTESIIRRAIVECNERELARLETRLRQIESERAFKIKEIGVLQRKRRRGFHMQLKRSALGRLLFGLSQRRALKERFQQWVKLWSQRVAVRASFEVQHGLLMQQHRLQQKQTQVRKDDIATTLTILHQHQKRRVQCRLCKQEYAEEQNNRYACSYHPGAYELACVQSCPTRQRDGVLASTSAANCMMHRSRRWLCCDTTEEGRYGSNGCARRFHLPLRENPALQQLVQKKQREEETLLVQLESQLTEVKERNTVGKAKQATQRTVERIESELATKRRKAATSFSLDRR